MDPHDASLREGDVSFAYADNTGRVFSIMHSATPVPDDTTRVA